MYKRTLTVLIFLISVSVLAAESHSPSLDIDFEPFKNFSKWNLVTVRYRENNSELRFVYANDTAFNALKKGEKYPDGAVFAKAAMGTEEDKAFPDARQPGKSIRYQLMIRDQKKYADTGGWGYALFDGHGVKSVHLESQPKACAACHSIVPERQFVFSKIAKLDPSMLVAESPETQKKFSFTTVPVMQFSEETRKKLPAQYKWARSVGGQIASEVFCGTFAELRNIMSKEASSSQMPVVIDSEHYSMVVFPEGKKDSCVGKDGERGQSIQIEFSQHLKRCKTPSSVQFFKEDK